MSPSETDFFTQDDACEIHLSHVLFFKLWRSVPLHGFAIVYLPTHLIKVIQVAFSWVVMNKAAINIVVRFLYERKFLFLRGKELEMGT